MPFSAAGKSFEIHEWRGSGPATLQVHHADDEAWHDLIVLTPRLKALIGALQSDRDPSRQKEIYRRFESELLE